MIPDLPEKSNPDAPIFGPFGDVGIVELVQWLVSLAGLVCFIRWVA